MRRGGGVWREIGIFVGNLMDSFVLLIEVKGRFLKKRLSIRLSINLWNIDV